MKQSKSVNIRMDEELHKKLEDYCWSNRIRVSTFIREVMEREMNRLEKLNGGNK